jgi:molecular chaperone DnaJ
MDLYERLGVTADASADDIKRAYRQLALKHHPDKNPDGNPETFQAISHAYSVLSDRAKRERYDQFGTDAAEAADFSDLFKDIFTGMPGGLFDGVFGPPRTMQSETVEVPISLRDVLKGTVRHIQFEALDLCPQCSGSGAHAPSDVLQCIACSGRGHVQQSPVPFLVATMMCPSCNGRGQLVKRPCAKCNGARTGYCKRSFEAKIPIGIPNGHRVTIPAKGSFDLNAGRHRDLTLAFKYVLPADTEVRGTDVHANVTVTLEDVLCGFRKPIDVYETPLHIHCPHYINPTHTLVIVNQGLPDAKNHAKRGDLVLHFKVEYPTDDRCSRYQEFLCKLFKRPFPPAPPSKDEHTIVV